MLADQIQSMLDRALQARAGLLDEKHEAAVRLFNGFLEGGPDWSSDLVIDLYAQTLVLYNYAGSPEEMEFFLPEVQSWFVNKLPWLQTVLVKTRYAERDQPRRGVVTYGEKPNRKIRENGVWYTVNLMLNMDASLYLDTRNLRAWAKEQLAGRRVLNTFAYTGSFGVAATAAKAIQVIQTDMNRRFLNLAKDSYTLNGFPIQRADFIDADFWVQMSEFNRMEMLFDCVFVDPPFFSVTNRGRVDLVENSQRVINKVRPLVGHQGWLVVVNNALFTSGADFMYLLEQLCADGYLTIEQIIPVPSDCTGYPETVRNSPPVDPAPFNHSTKIAVLRATRKDERTAADSK